MMRLTVFATLHSGSAATVTVPIRGADPHYFAELNQTSFALSPRVRVGQWSQAGCHHWYPFGHTEDPYLINETPELSGHLVAKYTQDLVAGSWLFTPWSVRQPVGSLDSASYRDDCPSKLLRIFKLYFFR